MPSFILFSPFGYYNWPDWRLEPCICYCYCKSVNLCLGYGPDDALTLTCNTLLTHLCIVSNLYRNMKFSVAVKLVTITMTLIGVNAASPPAPKADASSVEARNLQEGPTCTGPSLRRAWRDTSCADQEAYLEAVKKLKQLDPYPENRHDIPNIDLFSMIHNKNAWFAHGSNAFLQWHRWYLSRFERALQIVPGSFVSLLYWNWEIDSGNEDQSYVLKSSTFGSSDDISKEGCVTTGIADYQGIWTTTAMNGNCLKRSIYKTQPFCDESCLMQRIVQYDTFGPFSRNLEGYLHGDVHEYVG